MRVMFLGREVIGNEISVRFGISDIQIWVHRACIRKNIGTLHCQKLGLATRHFKKPR